MSKKNNPENMEEKNSEVQNNIENISKETTDSETKTEASEKEHTRKPAKSHSFNKRALWHGAMSVVLTVLFVAAVVVLNVIATIISDRMNASVDLTDNGIYTLDEKTEDYLKNTLNSDVEITVLSTESEFENNGSTYKQINEILGKMKGCSEHFKLSYIDPDSNPAYTSRFTGEDLRKGDIVVENKSNGRYRIITAQDYFGLDSEEAMYYYYYYGYIINSCIEQEAVSAMLYVTNDEPVRVAFTEGFGEADSTGLRNLLSDNGYDVETLNLMTGGEIDSEIDYVVIYAPSMDYESEQLEKLDKFLDNNGSFGKNVFYFASASQPQTPHIEEFLNDWGISFGYSVIGQSDANYLINSTTAMAHLQNICDTEYTGEVNTSGLVTLGANIRPVNTLDRSGNELTVLMKTYDNAFLYPLDSDESQSFDYDKAEKGVFNDAVMSSKTHSDGNISRVCVFGSEALASSYFLSYGNANNGSFFVNLFNVISGRENGITIQSKSFADVTFEMNASTQNTLTILLCGVIPVIVIVLGIVIWVRRRHR